MHLPDLHLHEPDSLREAVDLLGRHGSACRLLAGGTDLLVDLRTRRLGGIEHLVVLRGIPGLDRIEETAGGFEIGALVTPARIAVHGRLREAFPALAEAAGSMAGWQVRNAATFGGNIASGVPSSDLAPFAIAAGASAVLFRAGVERRLALSDFFLGPRKTACAPDEILTRIIVPNPRERTGISYQRFALRGANGCAVASVAAMLRLEGEGRVAEASLVLGAVAPIPVMAREAGALLAGRKATPEVFAEAARCAREEARPISDVRGSKEYRRELVKVLASRALAEAAERARSPR